MLFLLLSFILFSVQSFPRYDEKYLTKTIKNWKAKQAYVECVCQGRTPKFQLAESSGVFSKRSGPYNGDMAKGITVRFEKKGFTELRTYKCRCECLVSGKCRVDKSRSRDGYFEKLSNGIEFEDSQVINEKALETKIENESNNDLSLAFPKHDEKYLSKTIKNWKANQAYVECLCQGRTPKFNLAENSGTFSKRSGPYNGDMAKGMAIRFEKKGFTELRTYKCRCSCLGTKCQKDKRGSRDGYFEKLSDGVSSYEKDNLVKDNTLDKNEANTLKINVQMILMFGVSSVAIIASVFLISMILLVVGILFFFRRKKKNSPKEEKILLESNHDLLSYSTM